MVEVSRFIFVHCFVYGCVGGTVCLRDGPLSSLSGSVLRNFIFVCLPFYMCDELF